MRVVPGRSGCVHDWFGLSKKSLENRGDSSDDFSIHPILELLRGEPSAGKGADDVFTPPSFESSDLV